METIALVGPYGVDVKPLIEKKIGGKMRVISVLAESDFAQLGDVEYVILRVFAMDAKAIASMPRLRLLQRWGIGFDKVDIEAAGKRNIPVAIAPGGNATAVSELAILLMLAVYRNVIPLHEGVCHGKWEKEKYNDNSFVIRGKTVGLVGFGNIGAQVAQKVQAFGAQVIYYDVTRMVSDEELKTGVRYVDLDELLAQSDIVSLHLPLLESTRGMIDRRAIARMKRNAVLINTARGEIVDSDALAMALRSGKLLGAGLDVFDTEPLAPDSPLRGLDNIVFTPHTGGNTCDINGDMVDICVNNILAISEGRPLSPRVVVNSQFFRS